MNVVMTFLEGLASFLSPCTLPLVPVYVAYFAAEDRSKASAFARSLAFVLAFAIVFVTLGAFAGSVGRVLAAHRTAVRAACGVMMSVLGLGYLGWFRLPLGGSRRIRPVTGLVSAFLFGLAFALGLTPCVGAFLAAALLQAAAEGTALKGTMLLAAYSAGLGVPFVLSALLIVRLKGAFALVKAHYRALNACCGIFLVAAGAWLAGGELVPFLRPPSAPDGREGVLVTDEKQKEVKMEITLTAENFEAEVLRSGQPVLVDFWAPWCGPCQMLAPVLAEIAEERKGELKVGKVNVDDCPDLAARYGVMSIPAVFLFRNGQVVAQAVGYMSKEELQERVLRTFASPQGGMF